MPHQSFRFVSNSFFFQPYHLRFHLRGPCIVNGARRVLAHSSLSCSAYRHCSSSARDWLDLSTSEISTTPYHALSQQHQQTFDKLAALLDQTLPFKEQPSSSSSMPQNSEAKEKLVLVACEVLTTRNSMRHRGETHSPLAFFGEQKMAEKQAYSCGFTGVNYAFHTLVHPSPTNPLRGLLKGCAEQNALGAMAAAGLNYVYDTRAVYLAAGKLTRSPYSCCEGYHLDGPSTSPYQIEVTSPFPCRQCWSYLSLIGNGKHQLGLPPLELLIRVKDAPDISFWRRSFGGHINPCVNAACRGSHSTSQKDKTQIDCVGISLCLVTG